MPKFDADSIISLAPQQRLAVDGFRAIDKQLQTTPGADFFWPNQGSALFERMVGACAEEIIAEEADQKTVPREVNNLNDLEIALRAKARRVVVEDCLLSISKQIVAHATALAVVSDDSSLTDLGYEVGQKAIRVRAQTDATHLFIGGYNLTNPWLLPNEGQSIWARAQVIYEAKRIRPVTIDPKEGQTNDKYLEKAHQHEVAVTSPALMERFLKSFSRPETRTNSILKAIRRARRLNHAPQDADQELTLDSLVQQISANLDQQVPMELSEEEVKIAARFSKKATRFLMEAMHLSPPIGRDPRTKYFIYIANSLGGTDEAAAQRQFEMDIRRIAEQARAYEQDS